MALTLKHPTFESLFNDTANAIRAQSGSSDPIIADDFPEAIAALSLTSSGGISADELDSYEFITTDDIDEICGATIVNAATLTY